MIDSDSPFEMALAVAAANAGHNRFDLDVADGNGLAEFAPNAGLTVVGGRYPGL